MKNTCCFFLLSISLMWMVGCSHTGRLYPVQGPLSAQTPPPVLYAKVTGVLTSGSISVALSDGEICTGRWAIVPRVRAAKGMNPASAPADPMSAAWDTVYGPGFYVAHVLGAREYARATVAGNRGTVFNVEMYKPENTDKDALQDASAIKGVVKDSHDNVYKLVF